MFSHSRQKLLEKLIWGIGPTQIDYIEAWKYSPNSSCEHRVRYGRLTDDDVDDWLQQRGEYAPPPHPADAKVIGGLRLVLSEQRYYRPPSYSLSLQSYLKIEDQFHLPAVTLSALSNEEGSCSRYEEYDDGRHGKLRRIAFIIRAPQKYQVANYGLAVSYDFMTGLSTGILHGTGVVNRRADFPLWPKTPSAELFDAIESSAAMSAEPLYLPVVLLQHHLYRSREFCTVYMDKFYNEIQAGLGMSRAGRLHGMGEYEDPIGDKSINETRVSLRNLTGELNTLMTEAIWFSQVSEWHLEYANFLSDALGDLFRKAAAPEGTEQRAIRETIAYLGTCARGLRRQTNAAKERAAADFNILYSVTAQLDNRLNAKMSASASRDSMAMKLLAFITTLFLPGTFVATLFSMDMFNWQAYLPDESPNRVLSPYFWIYWAITAPLTAIVAFSWRIWWKWEKRNFDRDVRIEIENIESPGSMNTRKGPRRREPAAGESQGSWPALRRRMARPVDDA